MRDWVVGAGLLLREESLLLVHNRRRSGREDWTPPGGVIEEGEPMLVGLTREVQEETGIECEPLGVLSIVDGLRMGFSEIPLYSIVFHCQAIGGDPVLVCLVVVVAHDAVLFQMAVEEEVVLLAGHSVIHQILVHLGIHAAAIV